MITPEMQNCLYVEEILLVPLESFIYTKQDNILRNNRYNDFSISGQKVIISLGFYT